MQPRILIKEEGQKKKRFISPTEIKNNQLVYGDPVGSSKIITIPHANIPIGDRVYTRNLPSQQRINQQQKYQQSQYKTNGGEVRKNVEKNLITQSINSTQSYSQSSTSRHFRPQTTHQSSRSKSGKKDYMMAQLSRLNSKKSSKISDTESNSSQSRSKIGSVRSIDKNKNNLKTQREQQYCSTIRNVYNQKQTQINSPRQRVKESIQTILEKEKLNNKNVKTNDINLNAKDESKIVVKKPSITLSEFKVEQKTTSCQQNNQLSPRHNFQKNKFQNPQPKPVQLTERKQKIETTTLPQTKKQNYQFSRPKQIQESNDSSLAIHLKKAHDQKEELREKKIQAERERNEYKQRFETQQQQLMHLRKQIQHFQVQNLSLMSELKSIRQSQNLTKSELNDTNIRNEHLYREIHQKYTTILRDYKQSNAENDQLKHQIQQVQINKLNLQKKIQFLQQRIKQLEEKIKFNQNQHRNLMERTIFQWMERCQTVERELITFRSKSMSESDESSLPKFASIKKELEEKTQLLKIKNEQLDKIKKDHQIKITNLQTALYQKQKQAKQLNDALTNTHQMYTQKLFEHEKIIKNLQLSINEKDKQLQLRKIQVDNLKTKFNQSALKQQIQQLYTSNTASQQTSQAKSTVQHIISSQTSEVNHYKKQLNEKIAQNFQLLSEFQQLKSLYSNVHQQLEIMKLQYSALVKKQEQSSSTEMYIIKSQLESALRRQKELQQKLQVKTNQIKQKDHFIQNILMKPQNPK